MSIGSVTDGRATERPDGPAGGEAPFLAIEDLHVSFGTGDARREVVKGISLDAERGSCLAIVGESGSGKSVTARSIVGLNGDNAHVTAGRLQLGGRDLLTLGGRQWREVRGRHVGLILQDALVSLDPLRPVGKEIAEPLRLHRWGSKRERPAKVLELLRSVGVPEPELRAAQRSGELSGGLRQRALIASALALDPEFVIADEPTTALDVSVQAEVLSLLEATKAAGTTLIFISHDLAVVSRIADRIAVMRDGVIVEQGDAREVLDAPEHPYTQALLDAVPSAHSRGQRLSPRTAEPAALVGVGRQRREHDDATGPVTVLQADGLVKRYRGPDRVTRTVVDGVSFSLNRGETLGIVGESGSGKTTTARIALALTEPDEGTVLLDGRPWSGLAERERRERRRHITVVYQDPLSSFDPRWSVEQLLDDALDHDAYRTPQEREARVTQLLALVGLPSEHRLRKPLQLSGGQRQRVAIARALAPDPEIIVCDEPVSALDVSIQAQVLDLLQDLQRELGVSYLFISHDLGVIHHVSHQVLVMSQGRVVEQGPADRVFYQPAHPYTRSLLAAVPTLQRRGDVREAS